MARVRTASTTRARSANAELRRRLAELKRTQQALKQRTGELEAARRQAENARQQLEAVMQALPVGVAVTDVRGATVLSNRAFEETWRDPLPPTRSAADSAVYKGTWAETGKAIAPEEWASVRAVATGEAVLGQLLEIERFDGTRAVVMNSAAPVRDADGTIVGAAVAIQDVSELRRAEKALADSERIYRAIGESIDYGVWVCAPDGRNIYASDSFLRLVGLTQQQCSDFGWGEVLHPDDAERTIAAWKECVRTEGTWDIEHRFRGVDGKWHPVLARGVPVRSERGEILCWAGINIDISRLKRTEAGLLGAFEALGAAKQRLDSLLETSPLAVVEWSCPDYRIERWSPEAERLFGWTTAEAVGRRIDELPWVVEEDWPAVRQVMADMLAGKRPRTVNKNRNRRKDGSVVHCEWYNSTVTNPDGTVAAVLSLVLDVTELKTQERRVAQLSALYAVLSRVNETIVRTRNPLVLFGEVCRIVAGEGRRPLAWIGLVEGRTLKPVAWAGPAADYLRGIRVETDGEWGQGPSGTCVREGRTVVNDDFATNAATMPWREAARRHGLHASAAFPLRQRQKVIGALTLYASEPGTFDAEQVALLEALCADVSYALDSMEQERALRDSERSLREADQRKNDFLAILSHELRNPLTPIRNSLYILDQVDPASEQARRAKAVVDRQMEQLARLVDDLLDVTRITRGKIQIHRARLELGELVHRAAADYRSLFAEAGVALQLRTPREPLWADADGTRLAQAIGNLLQNAAKFTPQGGRVTLALEEDVPLRTAVVRVRDTGVGIPPEVLSRLFEPFTQAESNLDRSKGGLGLGLALVKGLVALHDGTVEARSAGVGQGAEFVLRLPTARDVAAEAPVPPAPTARPATRARPRRVLVVEDNLDSAESLQQALALAGHTVEVAHSGPDGLALARTFQPEVILCDIGLPGMDGYAVARAVRADARLSSVCLVALTGYALPEDLAQAREAGFDEHVAKPPSLARLAEILAGGPAAR